MDLGVKHAVEHLNRITSAAQGFLHERDGIKKFVRFLERLQAALEQLEALYQPVLPAAVATALGGIESDLQKTEEAFSKFEQRSRFFILIHGPELDKTIEDLTHSLGKWTSLIPFAGLSDNRELKKRIEELCAEMRKAKYEVTEAEERCLRALEKELESGRIDIVEIGTVWRDLARLIGVEPQMNSAALLEQIKLLREEVEVFKKDSEMQKMRVILKIFDQVTAEPQLTRNYSCKEAVEEEPLPAFDSFFCPLTKQIMKDPVMIQSERTYERNAIETWFKTCRQEGRDIVCPVTRSVLISTELRSNIMLRHTIEEWFQRNSKIRIHQALSQLSRRPRLEETEEALDSILKVCEDGQITQIKLGTCFTSSLLELWKKKMPEGSQLRTKALIILQRIAAEASDNQSTLVEAGVLKAAVRSLSNSQINESESALQLLLEISKVPELAAMIGKEKGALIHLLGIASNSSGNAASAVIAEKTLRNLETVDSNIWEMAEAGRLEPLLERLCRGPEKTQIEMANYLAERVFVDSQKEHVAKKAGKVLVDMLSGSPKAKEAALGALLNLSMLDDNVPVLVKAGILIWVVDIFLSVPTSSNLLRGNLKELAATTLANIVSVSGSWEAANIDTEGNTMQSEFFVHRILGLLSSIGPDWNSKLLKLLIGLASSPQAADSIATHIVSGNGIKILLALLQGNVDAGHRVYVLHLLSVLSLKVGKNISQVLVQARYLPMLKETLKQKNAEDSVFAATILSNVPLSEAEVVDFLGLDMIDWCTNTIEELKNRRVGSARVTSSMLEGLLGVLLQFARCHEKDVVEAMKQNRLMTHFKEVLRLHGQAMAKQKAALGLRYLSEKGLQHVDSKPAMVTPERRWLSFFPCMSVSSSAGFDLFCPFHKSKCDADQNFCLHEANATGLLVELLEEEQQQVQIAAIEALSTLVCDNLVEVGVRELSEAKAIHVIVRWFQTLRSSSSSEAQQKGTYLVERILRVEEHARRYSLDQGLMRSLVEVFKHGNPPARRTAEAALAHTHMLSVLSGGPVVPKAGKS